MALMAEHFGSCDTRVVYYPLPVCERLRPCAVTLWYRRVGPCLDRSATRR